MRSKQLMVVVVSLLVLIFSVSLAYFTTQIIGDGKKVEVSSTNLQIVFTDTDGEIAGADIEPGWSATKTFTVKNDSKSEYKYNIVIKDLVNTFVTEGYLQYKITSTNSGYNMTEFKDIPKTSTAKDTILAYSVAIPAGETQTCTIEFKYPNDENVDQGDDMGKVLKGTLFITEGTEEPVIFYNKILSDRGVSTTDRTDFSIKFDSEDQVLYTTTEEGTTVYYFAGNVTTNWVKFGKYQNDLVRYRGYYSETSELFSDYSSMSECTSASSYNINCTEYKYAAAGDDIYWRIIRTNSDGSIRLLYHGTSTTANDAYIGTSAFNSTSSDPMYVGYMYGTSGSLENNRTNENDSTIKGVIDTWYKDNLNANYGKYISTTAIYCNDRSVTNGTYSTSSSFYYAAYTRLGTNKTPTYDCAATEDKFTVSNTTGNGKLTYPIALMTADEISYAGGLYGSRNVNTWYYRNAKEGTLVSNSSNLGTSYGSTGSTIWWLMSPARSRYVSGIHIAEVFKMHAHADRTGFSCSQVDENTTFSVRPVISLKSCVKTSGGDGTPDSPYTIEETSSGC